MIRRCSKGFNQDRKIEKQEQDQKIAAFGSSYAPVGAAIFAFVQEPHTNTKG
jgi:hypothetical protein